MADSVKKPAHYFRYKIEPITFIMQNDVPYAEANAIKYLMRWRYKHKHRAGQIQDCKAHQREQQQAGPESQFSLEKTPYPKSK